jgi:hypothetical protein
VLGIAVATTVAIVFTVAPMVASATERGCPPTRSGFVLYEFFGQAGDPAPALGAEPLWDDTIVEPFTEVFGSLEAGLEAFGFESADELYAILLAEWLAIDKNGDSSLCQLDLPNTPGHPAWVFNAIDDNAKAPS